MTFSFNNYASVLRDKVIISGKVLALKIENFLYTNYLFFQRNKYFILNLYLIKMTLLYSNTFSGAFDY